MSSFVLILDCCIFIFIMFSVLVWLLYLGLYKVFLLQLSSFVIVGWYTIAAV